MAQACRNAALRVCDFAWMDKRFWSGAIVVVTVVVAGASALPGLLLRPASLDEPLVITAPAPKAFGTCGREGGTGREAGRAGASGRAAAARPSPTGSAGGCTSGSAGAAATASRRRARSPGASRTSSACVPAGAADRRRHAVGPGCTPDPVTPGERKARGGKPEGQKAKREKTRMTLQDAKARKRPVRPAIYPLREFFAWR